MSKLQFNNSNNAFFLSLKAEVDQYFSSHGKKRTGDSRLFTKAVILLSSAIILYAVLITNILPGWAAWALSGLLGFVMASIGFCVMHDANHGSFSTSQKLNDIMGLISSNGLGANAYFWKQKHNIIHHTYTNVDGIDDDIAKSPIIRQCPTQKWVPAHRVQHIYLPLVYSMTSMFWIFIMDFTKYFSRRIYRTAAWKMSVTDHLVFWVTKVYYVAVFMVIPIMLLGWKPWLIGYLTMNAVMGLTLSFVFQLAHVLENTEFEHVPLDTSKHIETAWAEHQLRTTSNFAMKNKFVSWFSGGLNFQIEHHLFPRISHVHYPAISEIVKRKCVEFNLPYNHYETATEALASHFRFMKSLGVKPAQEMSLQKGSPQGLYLEA